LQIRFLIHRQWHHSDVLTREGTFRWPYGHSKFL
jgi:hypothetical protein